MNFETYRTPTKFDVCVSCHRHTSLGHMSVLWEEHGEKVRICSWCDNGD